MLGCYYIGGRVPLVDDNGCDKLAWLVCPLPELLYMLSRDDASGSCSQNPSSVDTADPVVQ